MDEDEAFTEITLSFGIKAIILEATGKQFYEALQMSNKISIPLRKCVISKLVKINGKFITLDEIDRMKINDLNTICVTINAMMVNTSI